MLDKNKIAAYNSLAKRLCYTLPFWIGANYTLASPDDIVSEADVYTEIPIVTAATRLEQKVEDSPASITILTKELIQASGIQEVSQLFNLVPGFYSYHVFGQQPETTRGLASFFPGDTEVIIDGRSVYEPINSVVEWSSLGIDVDDIQHIEVVRGSNVPTYGSNASLGAINITTITPLQARGTHFSITASDTDYNARNANLRHYFSATDVEMMLGVNYRKDDAFPATQSTPPDPLYDQIEDSGETVHFRLRGIYTPSINDTFDFQIGVGDSDYNEPDQGLASDERGFLNGEFKRSHQQLRWQHQFESADLKTNLYHNRLEIDIRRKVGLVSERLMVPPAAVQAIFGHPDTVLTLGLRDTLSERYDAETQLRATLGKGHRMVIGVGARYDRIQGRLLLDRDDSIDDWRYRTFANWELAFSERWRVNVGMMAEQSSSHGIHYSPRLGINFKPAVGHSLRLVVTESRRLPSLLEIHQMQVARFDDGTLIDTAELSSSDIDTTKVREYELGYHVNLFDNRVVADIRLFKTNVNDAITERIDQLPTDPIDTEVLTRGNFADFDIEGIELQVKVRPDERSLVYLAYSRNRFTGTQILELNPFRTTELINQLPKDGLSFLIQRTLLPGLDASLTWYHWSESKPLTGDFLDDRNRLDFRLAKAFRVNETAVTFELLVHNIINESYSDFFEENVFERRVIGKIRFQF